MKHLQDNNTLEALDKPNNKINASKLFNIETDLEASDFIKKKGVKQVSDKSEIETLIKSVLQKNVEMVNDYKKGKDKLFGFFVGQVMKESKGKANPQLVNQVLKDLLSK